MRQSSAEGEERLLRTAMLWLLALSAIGAPRTFAAAPVPVPVTLVAFDVVCLSAAFVLLWRRIIGARAAAASAAVIGTVAASRVFWDVIAAVADGQLSTEAAGNVLLPTLVTISGVSFIALRVRSAVLLSLGVVVSQVVVIVLVAGDQATALLTDRGIAQAFRFGVTAAALFLVATVLSVARARERDQAEVATALAVDQAADLETREHLRRRLYHEAAHELKGPLTIVRAAGETLSLQRGSLRPEQEDALIRALVDAVDRLGQRVGEVLESGDPAATMQQPVEADAEVAVRRAVRLVAGVVTEAPVEVSGQGGIIVEVVPAALEHVLENMLTNASKYGTPGAPVEVVVGPEGDGARVRVISQGGDLSRDDEQRVFEAGFRAHGAEEVAEGMGVGLSLVKRLVEAWGGEVDCEVGDDTTTFSFTLPAPRLADLAVVDEGQTSGVLG